jgi:hypothetical protein
MSNNYYPEFYDIASDVFPKYSEYGYIISKYYSCKTEMIQDYVNKHSNKFNPGDILFVGSTYESRQYSEGFTIITNGNIISEYKDCGISLPLFYRNKIPEKIYYKKMFDKVLEKIKVSTDYYDYDTQLSYDFFGIVEGDSEEIISTYDEYELKRMLTPEIVEEI